jgi:hypothetical protein
MVTMMSTAMALNASRRILVSSLVSVLESTRSALLLDLAYTHVNAKTGTWLMIGWYAKKSILALKVL